MPGAVGASRLRPEAILTRSMSAPSARILRGVEVAEVCPSSGVRSLWVPALSCITTGAFLCHPQVQLVELLVAHGADLNGKSVLDETPLGEPGGQTSVPAVLLPGVGRAFCLPPVPTSAAFLEIPQHPRMPSSLLPPSPACGRLVMMLWSWPVPPHTFLRCLPALGRGKTPYTLLVTSGLPLSTWVTVQLQAAVSRPCNGSNFPRRRRERLISGCFPRCSAPAGGGTCWAAWGREP